MAIIKVRDLEYTYNKKTVFEKKALAGISFDVMQGEILAVCGSTGSGKSTLIRHLNGLIFPDSGQVNVFSGPVTKKTNLKSLRKRIGMVFQYPDHQIFETNVKREMTFACIKFGHSRKEALKMARKACGMYEFDFDYYKNRNPFELSGGEKRKVAICSVLAYQPEILVFDEPTAGLDNNSKKEFERLLYKLEKTGKTVILISHDMEFIIRNTSRTIVLHKGTLEYNGKTEELFLNTTEKKLNTYGLYKSFLYRIIENTGLTREYLNEHGGVRVEF